MTRADLARAAGAAALTLVFGCGRSPDVVFVAAEIQFAMAESRAREANATRKLEVVLSGPVAFPVTVAYEIIEQGARGDRGRDCGGRDFSRPDGALQFQPGQTSASIDLEILDDGWPEADEALEAVLGEAQGVRLGARTRHRLVIEDDDRAALFDVRDFGAAGDGRRDDTGAVQAAIEAAAKSQRAVVLVPPGTYVLTSVRLASGVAYHGHGATIVSPPMVPPGTRLFSVAYGGDRDSQMTVVQGFTLDGDRERQGPYRGFERAESHLLALEGELDRTGRLRALVQDVRLRRSTGDGLVAYRNVDVVACDLQAEDVWRDAFAVRGGNSVARLRGLRASGVEGTTGVAIAPSLVGAGATLRVDVTLEDALLDTGDLLVSVQQGSRVTVRGLKMNDPPFLLSALDSTLRFTDSVFWVGYPSEGANRIESPGDTRFERCTFHLAEVLRDGSRWSRGTEPADAMEANRPLQVADVYWHPSDRPDLARRGQRLQFVDCTFLLAPDVEDGDTVYVARTQANDSNADNEVVIQGGTVAAGFDGMFAPSCTRCSYRP